MSRSLAALALTCALTGVAAAQPRLEGAPGECPADGLRTLKVRGLTPSFSPSTPDYRMPVIPGGIVEVTTTPCDPTLSVQVNGVAVQPGVARAIWVGARANVVLHRGWSEIRRYVVTVDATLPEAPPDPGVDAIVVPGLSRGFDPRVAGYRVLPRADGFVPVTVAFADPTLRVYVQGTEVQSGRAMNAWAPRGGAVSVVAYRNWAEVARYKLVVDEELPPFKLGAIRGRLYVSGERDLAVIDISTGAISEIDVPGVSETYLLARGDDHARLYVSSPSEHTLSAVGLKSQAVQIQRFFSGENPWRPGGIAITPGSEHINLVHMNSGVMATYDKDLSYVSVEIVPFVSMPMLLAYAPNSLDLWVTDFSASTDDGVQLVVRKPQVIDWQAGLQLAWWPASFPPTKANTDGDSGAGFDFLPKQGLAVAANSLGDELVVLDDETLEPLGRTAVGRMPFFVTADPASTDALGRVFVTSLQGGTLGVYTVELGATGGVTITRVTGHEPNPCPASEYPQKVVFGSVPSDLYLLCSGSVVRLDPSSLDAVESFPLGGERVDMVWAVQ